MIYLTGGMKMGRILGQEKCSSEILGFDSKEKSLPRRGAQMAYCSGRCSSLQEPGRNGALIPEAKRMDVDCPRCGHALFWKVPNSRTQVRQEG